MKSFFAVFFMAKCFKRSHLFNEKFSPYKRVLLIHGMPEVTDWLQIGYLSPLFALIPCYEAWSQAEKAWKRSRETTLAATWHIFHRLKIRAFRILNRTKLQTLSRSKLRVNKAVPYDYVSAQIFKLIENLTVAVGTQPSWCLSCISETYQTIDQKSGYEISTKKNCLSLPQPRKSLNFFKLSFYNCKTWVWSSLHHFNTVTVTVTNSPIYRTFLFWRIKFQLLTLRHTVHMCYRPSVWDQSRVSWAGKIR